jgi:hypothetical protein
MEETDEGGSSLIAIDKRFDKLLTGLRTAVANEYKLDKEVIVRYNWCCRRLSGCNMEQEHCRKQCRCAKSRAFLQQMVLG